jgi:hypothetical protein
MHVNLNMFRYQYNEQNRGIDTETGQWRWLLPYSMGFLLYLRSSLLIYINTLRTGDADLRF